MKLAALLASTLIIAPTLALATPRCDSSDAEVSEFVRGRVSVTLDEGPMTRDPWVVRYMEKPDHNAERMWAFCAQHPSLPLHIAFAELFGAD
jgi:hypothetical protein